MTELKREIIDLIDSIPDERENVLIQVRSVIRELLDGCSQRQEKIYDRVEQNLAMIEDLESLTQEGGDAKVGR